MYYRIFLLITMLTAHVQAYCIQDHLFIGCNQDGITGTDDDQKLFIDCRHKYRNASPQWHYSLYQSGFNQRNWVINEPGFDEIHDPNEPPSDHPLKDPNSSPQGTRNTDYQIWIECVDISENFKVCNLDESILLDEPGDAFNHSYYSAANDGHLHLWYIYTNLSASDPAPTGLLWATFRVYDNLGPYHSSEPFTVVFVSDPLSGDIVVDNFVNLADFAFISRYWLSTDASTINDYQQRADHDRSGTVDLLDLIALLENYLAE